MKTVLKAGIPPNPYLLRTAKCITGTDPNNSKLVPYFSEFQQPRGKKINKTIKIDMISFM